MNDKKRYCEVGSTSVLWKRYQNNESYNDLCEYNRALNRATTEYIKSSIVLKKRLANNVETDPKSFYAYVRSELKTKTNVRPLRNRGGDFISDDL